VPVPKTVRLAGAQGVKFADMFELNNILKIVFVFIIYLMKKVSFFHF